jgi:hypothetical protein
MADEQDQDLTKYADKPGTPMHDAFVEWMLDETGYDPNSAKTKADAFARGVILGAYLRPTYQRSEANHDRRTEPAPKPVKAAKTAKAAPEATPAKGKSLSRKTAPAAEAAPRTGSVRKATPKKAVARSNNTVEDTPF